MIVTKISRGDNVKVPHGRYILSIILNLYETHHFFPIQNVIFLCIIASHNIIFVPIIRKSIRQKKVMVENPRVL